MSDAPQENPTCGNCKVCASCYAALVAAGRSAERARLAEAERLLRAITDCYPNMIPAALNAEADAFLHAALSEGSPE
jgi:hypothetical protein